jgi:hypothetical protein
MNMHVWRQQAHEHACVETPSTLTCMCGDSKQINMHVWRQQAHEHACVETVST